MPSAAKPASSRMPFKLLRSILRRWAKALWTMWAKRPASLAVSRSGAFGVSRTTAESTLGGGSKLSGGTSISHSSQKRYCSMTLSRP